MKKQENEKTSAESSYSNNLNQRIDELESAIGQNEATSLSRAYAIREEASRIKIPDDHDANTADSSDDDSENKKLDTANHS